MVLSPSDNIKIRQAIFLECVVRKSFIGDNQSFTRGDCFSFLVVLRLGFCWLRFVILSKTNIDCLKEGDRDIV